MNITFCVDICGILQEKYIVMMIFLYGFAFIRVRRANINVEERIVEKKEEFDKIIKDYNQKTTKKTRRKNRSKPAPNRKRLNSVKKSARKKRRKKQGLKNKENENLLKKD